MSKSAKKNLIRRQKLKEKMKNSNDVSEVNEMKREMNKKRGERRQRQWARMEEKMVEFVRTFYCAICYHFLVFPTRIECGHVFCKR